MLAGARAASIASYIASLAWEAWAASATSRSPNYRGGMVAREAKALAPSACVWAGKGKASERIRYQEMLDRSVRAMDPFVRLSGRWIVRRLAPDCSRIELSAMPKERDEIRLLRAMGFETANVHLGTRARRQSDSSTICGNRTRHWLHEAATAMVKATTDDWREWRARIVQQAAWHGYKSPHHLQMNLSVEIRSHPAAFCFGLVLKAPTAYSSS